jgi:hypothetical protein
MLEITACPTFTVILVLKQNFLVTSTILHHIPDKQCVMCESVLNDVKCVLNMVNNICEQIL